MEPWAMGAGLRPVGKPADRPPDPNVVARHRSIPTTRDSGFTGEGVDGVNPLGQMAAGAGGQTGAVASVRALRGECFGQWKTKGVWNLYLDGSGSF